MYGIGDIVRAVIDEGKVKFQYVRSGQIFSKVEDAFQAAGKEGVTTFTRLTGKPETSSLNTRGLLGLEERLLQLQKTIALNPEIAKRFGIDDPMEIAFEVGTFKTAMGEKNRLSKIIEKLGEGLIVPDNDEFNFFQIRVGKDRLLSFEEMNEILLRTSQVDDQFLGGFFSTNALEASLLSSEKSIVDLFSKYGKRARGAIGIRDVSLAGEILERVLAGAGVQGGGLSQENIKIFKVADDIQEMTQKLLGRFSTEQIQSGISSDELYQAMFEGLDEEKIAYYGGGERTLNLIRGALEIDETAGEMFRKNIESAYDGSAVINAKLFRSIKREMEEELSQLDGMTNKTPEINERILELNSQLRNMTPENFQAVTSRIFFPLEEDGKISPKMIKAVLDQALLKGPLDKYAMLVPDVAIKSESGIMGRESVINLVLQGEPSDRVYYDPLAPAFHYDIFSSPEYQRAQEARIARITNSFQHAVETGEINESLKKQIFSAAERDISGLPEASRLMAERNRLFMQRLKQAIESGVDIRTVPQLLNYLAKNVQSQLYREKDGVFQIAMDNVFRVALDTEARFYAGTKAGESAYSVGAGLTDLKIATTAGELNIQALEFSVQGHKMLFGGNTAALFKQPLGGFDLDDKGIVMPRIIKDASGTERLGTFIFRQPTGPAEFVFAMPKFGTADTIKMFLHNNDALMNQLEEVKFQNGIFELMYDAVTKSGTKLTATNERLARLAESREVEKAIIELMRKAESTGEYVVQTLTGEEKIFEMLRRAGQQSGQGVAAPLQLDKNTIKRLIQSGSVSTLEENLLVNQYHYGDMIRIFSKSKGFEFDKATKDSLRRAGITGDITEKTVYEAIANAKKNGDIERSIKLSNIVSKIYKQKTEEALEKRENIGSYINRLVVASASADQEEEIYKALTAKGLGDAVNQIRTQTTIGVISPSDVVDLINYMSGEQRLLGTEKYYQMLENIVQAQGGDPIRVVNAVKDIAKKQGIELSESVAQAAIEQKFSRIGRLRARAIQAGLDPELIAGIDPEFIRARLKSSDDAARALQFLESGFTSEVKQINKAVSLPAEVSDQFSAYTAQLEAARKAENYNLTNELIRVAAISSESQYAHASKNIKLGQLAADSMDAVQSQLYSRARMQYLGEVKASSEASRLAENILKQFSTMQDEAMDQIDLLTLDSSNISELMRYKKMQQTQIIGNKLRSMILGAAQESESTTVQDILDNMERLTYSSKYRKLSKYQNLITGVDGINDIVNLVEAAKIQREIKFLTKQRNVAQLTDELTSLMQRVSAMTNEEKAVQINLAQGLLQSPSPSATAEDKYLAAALLKIEGKESLISSALGDETSAMGSRISQLYQARRRMSELGIEDILSYGGQGTSAANFAPPPASIDVDLTDEERRLIFQGTKSEEKSAADQFGVRYKRIVDSWRDGKLGEAFKNPTVRRSSYAVLGLIAASFIYSASKDRGEQEIAGPPLLPGGSAYETLPTRSPQIPNQSMFSGYNQGTGYSVNIEGSQDQVEAFRQAAGSVANGPINSTMYRGLPQLGRDNYSQIASSF